VPRHQTVLKLLIPSKSFASYHSHVKHTKSKESGLLGSYTVSTGLFDPDDEGFTVPRNVGKFLRIIAEDPNFYRCENVKSHIEHRIMGSHGAVVEDECKAEKLFQHLAPQQRPPLLCQIASPNQSVRSVSRDVKIRCKV
jgi:hypothetical protein